ncbi:calcium-binding protein P isoform X2 [Drosophila guanche]|uniref:calcium-binding protein P isoform X2 n=1 Tax=Drosophila guanche TaxID=7266 RepID=UPI001470B873|nr:calcium-binding protein P isoform X2 [Drosophila guanche]
MAWRSVIAFAGLIVALLLAVESQASQLSRDESREDEETNFNLASTLTGGIRSSRHHQRANLNSNLNSYPDSTQPGAGYGSVDIDGPHGHEQGGYTPRAGGSNSIGYSGPQQPAGYPGQELPPGTYPPPGYPATGSPQPPVHYPGGIPAQRPGVPSYPQPGVPAYPQPGAHAYPQPGIPGYAYPGVYLPQFPGYPQPGAYPGYAPGAPGGPPVVVHPGAAPPAASPHESRRHHSRYPSHNAQDPEHWDHRFSMNTEYKEDGVHKGSFDVLNNHNAFGFGSGYGGGYNGAFNSPAF